MAYRLHMFGSVPLPLGMAEDDLSTGTVDSGLAASVGGAFDAMAARRLPRRRIHLSNSARPHAQHPTQRHRSGQPRIRRALGLTVTDAVSSRVDSGYGSSRGRGYEVALLVPAEQLGVQSG